MDGLEMSLETDTSEMSECKLRAIRMKVTSDQIFSLKFLIGPTFRVGCTTPKLISDSISTFSRSKCHLTSASRACRCAVLTGLAFKMPDVRCIRRQTWLSACLPELRYDFIDLIIWNQFDLFRHDVIAEGVQGSHVVREDCSKLATTREHDYGIYGVFRYFNDSLHSFHVFKVLVDWILKSVLVSVKGLGPLASPCVPENPATHVFCLYDKDAKS